MRFAFLALLCSFLFVSSCSRKTNRVVTAKTPTAAPMDRPTVKTPPPPPAKPRFNTPPAEAERVYAERDTIWVPDPSTVPEPVYDRSGRRPTPSPVTKQQSAEREARDDQRNLIIEQQQQMLRAKNLKALSEDANIIFSLTKTPCRGECEEYRLDVLENGVLRYEGRANTKLRGEFYTEPFGFKFAELTEAYDAFMALEPRAYYPNADDAPADATSTILTYFTDKGKEKEITVWYGEPQEFITLMEMAESFIAQQRWEK